MRFTCIALAAVSLALVQPRSARGVLPTLARGAPHAAAAAGVIDYTPVPTAAAGDDAAATLSLEGAPTRCASVKRAEGEARLVVVPCADGTGQPFTFTGGAIRAGADLCVTAPAHRDHAVRAVALAPCNGSPAQRWQLTPAGEYRDYLDKCLTAAGPQRRSGTPVAVRRCMGRSDQRWAAQAIPVGVHAEVDSIRLNAVALSLTAGASAKINGVPLDADGCEVRGGAVSWASADPSVATVTADGTVIGVGGGSTTVIAMSHGRVRSVAVEVRAVEFAGSESGTPTYGVDRR